MTLVNLEIPVEMMLRVVKKSQQNRKKQSLSYRPVILKNLVKQTLKSRYMML